MPFGPYPDFDACVASVSQRKNPPSNPKAYCGWLKDRIEGGNFEFIQNEELLITAYHQYCIDFPLENVDADTLQLMNKEDAKRILNAPADLKEWADVQLIDDHRWIHLWEKTLERGDKLFLTKDELKKLHEHLITEMKKRGMDSGTNHKSPVNVGAALLQLSSPIQLKDPILLDAEFISIVGSAVISKDPQDLDLMMNCPPNEKFQAALLKALPEDIQDKIDFIFESSGPNGPYIPAFALYAVPLEHLSVKEPKFDVTPLSPNLPAAPTMLLEDPKELSEDSYYVESVSGVRTMVHRKGDVVIAFDKDLEEVELSDEIIAELKSFEDPETFILDGFLSDGVFRMIDLVWWKESQHVKQTAEVRRSFLAKMPEAEHVKRSEAIHFENKADTINYLKGKNGPLLLIPGMTPYPSEGKAQWLLYAPKKSAYLVKARLGSESPIVCALSPWIAVPGQEWSYLQNNETVWPQLTALGIGRLVGTECQEDARIEAAKHGISYELTQHPTVKQFINDGPVAQQTDLASAEINPEEFKAFYDSIRPLPREVMKLSCGGVVPLKRLRLQKGLYNSYPDESKDCNYAIQFHVKGLDVHADLRYQVNTSQAIGWTLNLGSSLIKPMLRRTPETLKEKAGITAEHLKLSVKELTAKLNATAIGRTLGNAFTKKLRALDRSLIKTMLREVWTDEVNPALTNAKGILAQRKYPVTPDWLRFEAVPEGAVGATNEVGGTMYLMDAGKIRFGDQTSNLHEYWLDGKYIKRTRMLVRRFSAKPEWETKEAAGWMVFFSKKLDAGLQFSVGREEENHWLLIHDDEAVHQTWDFGNSNPIRCGGLPIKLSVPSEQLMRMNTIDTGGAEVIQDNKDLVQLQFNGNKLKGSYVLVKDGETWNFGPASISEEKKTLLLASYPELYSAACPVPTKGSIMHLAASDMEFEQVGDLLFLRGPAIKPGEVIPMDGRPSYFTKEGIEKFWPSMYRQPIVVLHGDLKGDVIGFVSRNWFDMATGWGWVEGIVWHPQGIKLIMDKKLPAFSIEVIPESVWDAEHKHEHVIGGTCVGLAVVPKGACVTCTPTETTMGAITVEKGKVFKYGMKPEQYIIHEYWARGKSTRDISMLMDMPRSTVESWMNQAGIPRRSLLEARRLRQYREEAERKFGGRAFITNLGRGATLFTIGDEHLLVNAPEGISTMLGFKKLKPKCVLIENSSNAAGIEELGALAPVVLATEKTWKHIRAVNPGFEYKGKRMVIPLEKVVKIGSYMVRASELGDSTAYKIDAGGNVILHTSQVSTEPSEDMLNNVDIFIGDGTALKEDIDGHVSMVKQTLRAKDAEVLNILFTNQNEDYEELSVALQDIAPNAGVFEEGAELQLSPGNPGAHFSFDEAGAIAAGNSIIVRDKPYQEYAKQAIYLLGGDQILGLYVEGFPEGPIAAEKAKAMEHGLSDEVWAERFEGVEQVWIYKPRMLKSFENTRDFRLPESTFGPYIHHVKTSEG